MELGKLVTYNFSNEGKDAQSYTLLIEHNGKSISGMTLPDEYIRFAQPCRLVYDMYHSCLVFFLENS